jgi:hypothetical protein
MNTKKVQETDKLKQWNHHEQSYTPITTRWLKADLS